MGLESIFGIVQYMQLNIIQILIRQYLVYKKSRRSHIWIIFGMQVSFIESLLAQHFSINMSHTPFSIHYYLSLMLMCKPLSSDLFYCNNTVGNDTSIALAYQYMTSLDLVKP